MATSQYSAPSLRAPSVRRTGRGGEDDGDENGGGAGDTIGMPPPLAPTWDEPGDFSFPDANQLMHSSNDSLPLVQPNKEDGDDGDGGDDDELTTKSAEERFHKELRSQGINPIIANKDVSDNVSIVTFGDESYILDLARQKETREDDLKEEALEDSLIMYKKAVDGGIEADEKLFLLILNETKEELEEKYKEKWESQDEILREVLESELKRRKKQGIFEERKLLEKTEAVKRTAQDDRQSKRKRREQQQEPRKQQDAYASYYGGNDDDSMASLHTIDLLGGDHRLLNIVAEEDKDKGKRRFLTRMFSKSVKTKEENKATTGMKDQEQILAELRRLTEPAADVELNEGRSNDEERGEYLSMIKPDPPSSKDVLIELQNASAMNADENRGKSAGDRKFGGVVAGGFVVFMVFFVILLLVYVLR